MPPLFAGQSTHIEFICDGGNVRCIMFQHVFDPQHMFDPASIVAFRLLVVLAQTGGAVLIVSAIIAIRRWRHD